MNCKNCGNPMSPRDTACTRCNALTDAAKLYTYRRQSQIQGATGIMSIVVGFLYFVFMLIPWAVLVALTGGNSLIVAVVSVALFITYIMTLHKVILWVFNAARRRFL